MPLVAESSKRQGADRWPSAVLPEPRADRICICRAPVLHTSGVGPAFGDKRASERRLARSHWSAAGARARERYGDISITAIADARQLGAG